MYWLELFDRDNRTARYWVSLEGLRHHKVYQLQEQWLVELEMMNGKTYTVAGPKGKLPASKSACDGLVAHLMDFMDGKLLEPTREGEERRRVKNRLSYADWGAHLEGNVKGQAAGSA